MNREWKSTGGEWLFFGGHIFTGDPLSHRAEALVVQRGRIAFVGSTENARGMIGPQAEHVSLAGRLLLPGFHDAHVHFALGGFSLLGIDLRGAASERAMAEMVQAHARGLAEGEWVTGGYWDHQAWPGRRLPSRRALDDSAIDRPVLLHRVDTHIALANGIALKLAGIGRDTPDPAGGEIHHDPVSGEPDGILADNAITLVERLIPPPPPARREAAICAAAAAASRFGITAINDNASIADFSVYQKLRAEGRLTLRLNAMQGADDFASLRVAGISAHSGDAMLRRGTVKLFADGSFGASTAWLHRPYQDHPGSCGLAIHPPDELERLVGEISRSGMQLAIHAIGDRAVSEVLTALGRVRGKTGPAAIRHRIEHAQMVRDEDMERFLPLGVVLSLQPSHCLADLKWAAAKIGERARTAYRLRSFRERGIPLAFGSDWPVESLDPLTGIYAAVSRRLPDGSSEWFPEEAISTEEAIAGFTLGSALAEGQEGITGTLTPGKLADLVILDRDIFQAPPREILEAKVDLTLLGGLPVFRR